MRTVGVVAGLGAVLLLAGPAAAAGPDLALSDVQVSPDVRSVDLTVSAPELPPGTGLDPASLRISVDGRTLPASSVVASAEASEPARVLLVVDTSGSMAGQPMAEAKQAISAFVAQAPDDVRLGLLTFSTTPRLQVPPTADRSRLLGAVAGLQAQGETSLYDAVLAGVQALGTGGDRRLVVLSDGGDTRSRSPLPQVLASTRGAGVVVDAIGFRTGESVQDVLAQVAGSGRGRVHAAGSSAELATALSASTRQHARSLAVRALVPRDVRGPRQLDVLVVGPGGVLAARTRVVLGTAHAATAAQDTWWSRNALLVALVATAGSLLLGSLALLGGGSADRRRTSAVLDRFTTTPPAASPGLRTASPVARTALELAGRVTERQGRSDRTALQLARAAVSLTPAEWLLLRTGVGAVTALLLVLLSGNLLVAGLLGAAAGGLVPSAVLRVRGSRRQRAFEEQLPDALQMTAGSLSAGYSLAQALDGLVREGAEPMATEIGRALAESRLGVPVETTLTGVADRMASRDFGWVVMAIRVQREVGGNLAGVLTTVAGTMRERAMMRRHVSALSAEGRLSAYILIGLPIALVLYLLTVRGDYLEPMWTTAPGLAMVTAAVGLLVAGSFLMSRIVKVEV